MQRVRSAGFEVMVVGGFVRDLLLGRTPRDVDLVTNATTSQVRV
jgi:poly(A) polymerase